MEKESKLTLSQNFQVFQIKKEIVNFLTSKNNYTLEEKAEILADKVGNMLSIQYAKDNFWTNELLRNK